MRIDSIKKIMVFFVMLSSVIYGASVDEMKNQVKKLDKEIKVKNERIETIDIEKETISHQIEEIKKDIAKVSKEIDKINEEIQAVSKNIDYGKRNLDFNLVELQRKKALFDAKIIAWSRKERGYRSFDNEYIIKKEFAKVLYEDLSRMKKIKKVQGDIKEVKKIREEEKNYLRSLNSQLDKKKAEISKKQKQQNALIAKLNSEKKNHIRTIGKIEKQKRRLEKEIENIIKNRASVTKNVKYEEAKSRLGKAIKPIQGPIVLRFNENKTKNVKSNGIEIRGTLGKEIKSAMAGKVIYIDKLQGLGKVIMIDYGYNTIGVYGNTIGSKVKINQRVNKGEVIGILGYSTEGKSNLYYEVRFNLKPVDPEFLF